MKLPPAPGRPLREPIGPLVDVVFLLLVFFLLAGTLEPVSPLRVEPPRAQPADMAADGPRPWALALAADGRVALDGELVADDERNRLLAERLPRQPGRPVRLMADAETPAGELLSLLVLLRQLDAGEVSLVTRPAAVEVLRDE